MSCKMLISIFTVNYKLGMANEKVPCNGETQIRYTL